MSARIWLTIIVSTAVALLSGLCWLAASREASSTVLSIALGGLIGFGMRHWIADLSSGLILRVERIIGIGDHIELDGASGVVTRVGFVRTKLIGGDDKIVRIANRRLASQQVIRRPHKSGRLRFRVLALAGTNPEHLCATARRAAISHDGVRSTPSPEIFFQKIEANEFQFEFVVWSDVPMASVSALTTELCFRLGRAFADEAISASVEPHGHLQD